MTDDRPLVSAEVFARYARDAALEVEGVASLADGVLHRGGAVEISEGVPPSLTLHLELVWGSSAREVGEAVQQGVASYLETMTGAAPASVDVRFESVGSPPRAG